MAGQNGGDLDTLHLAAGQGHVHLPVKVIVGAQAHLGQIRAAAILAELFLARRQQQQIMDGDALEAGRLLEAVADALFGPFGDGQARDILAVIEDLAAGGLHQTHDDLGQRGLAAAVGAGEHHQAMVGNGDGDILDDIHVTLRRGHAIGNMFQFQHGIFLLKLNRQNRHFLSGKELF